MSLNILIAVAVVAAIAWFVWQQRGKSASAAAALPDAAAASYEDYRRLAPSNMINGKLTCKHCGSNLLRQGGGVASCSSCGSALYRL
jgi:lipopolysaccharide export system protein LptC